MPLDAGVYYLYCIGTLGHDADVLVSEKWFSRTRVRSNIYVTAGAVDRDAGWVCSTD